MSVRRGRNRENAHLIDENLTVEDGEERPTISGIRGDGKNIAILFFLYLLQGIPLGLMQAIPIILTKSGVSYKQQAQFSLVTWPFSLKLLWAPIVDSVFWPSMGKRKSWLVPVQYLIGALMLVLSFSIDSLLAVGKENGEPNILLLVIGFFTLNFLAATQDIAVDGWALTMLKRENVAYASTCNSVGQTAGYIFGYVAFIALESSSFCNSYLRDEELSHGVVTLPGFLKFWGWVFLVTTTLVWLLKSEVASVRSNENLSVAQSYRTLWQIMTLKPICLLAAVLLTAKVAFSASDALTPLKLIEAGVPKEKLALMAIPMVPLQILLPLILSRRIVGPNPMDVYLSAYPYRLAFGLVIALLVWTTPSFIDSKGDVPYYYYIILLLIYSIYQVGVYSMFVSQMAFFATISDPAVGGTYMTLVNTLANLGGNWPTTLSLWLVDGLTMKRCSLDESNSCVDSIATNACTVSGGECLTEVDGYYIETLSCVAIGALWLLWGRGAVRKLQNYPMRAFAVTSNSR